MGMIIRLRRILLLAIVTLTATWAAVVWQAQEMLAAHGDGRSISQPAGITIVLASGVDPDLVLGFSSRRRVRLGVELLARVKTGQLLMSGGPIDGSERMVAHLMRDFALSLGAPTDAILIEDRSRTTFENLLFSKEVIAAQGDPSVALLTDEMHLTRASLLADFLGLKVDHLVAVRGRSTEPMILALISITREAMAWWYNLGKILGWWSLGLLGWSDIERSEIIA